MFPETFISSDFVRHEALPVEVLSTVGQSTKLKGLHTRYVRRHGLVIECPEGLDLGKSFRTG